MLIKKGRLLVLREIQDADVPILWAWRNDVRFMNLCSTRRNEVTLDEFADELRRDLSYDRFLQCMLVKNQEPVGTVYGYNLNQTDGFAFMTAYVNSEYEHTGVGAEGCALFMGHLFEAYDLFKLYADVYSYNEHSLSCLRNAGFVEEGKFVGHRLLGATRYDLIRMAFFRNELLRLERFIKRLLVRSL